MTRRRYISKDSLQQLALAGGITSLSKNSIDKLSDIYLIILWSIIEHGRRKTEKRSGKNITVNDIIRGLKEFNEPIKKTETLMQNINRCETFRMKKSRYSTYENYNVKKVEFYMNLKKCSLFNEKSHNELIKMIIDKTQIKYNIMEQTKIVIKKTAEKVYKRFMQGLGEDLEEQGKKILKTQLLEEVWEIFKTTRDIIERPTELKEDWYYKTKTENEIKKENNVNQFLVESLEEDENENKVVNNILWPMALNQQEIEKESAEKIRSEPNEVNEIESVWPMEQETIEEIRIEPNDINETEIDLNTVNVSEPESESQTSETKDESDILEDAAKFYKEELDKLFKENYENDLLETEMEDWNITVDKDDPDLEKEIRNF